MAAMQRQPPVFMRNQSFSLATPNLPWLATFTILAMWLLSAVISRADQPPRPGYESGFSNITKLAGELHAALDSKKQQAIQREVILLESVKTPYVGPGAIKE